jgi:hypothetical protein
MIVAVIAIHASDAPEWIDHPDEFRSRIEPVRDLRQKLTGAVVRRDDFHREIRRQRRIATPRDLIRPGSPDDCHVRRADGVRTRRELETGILAADHAELVPVYVVRKQVRQSGGNAAVPSPGRLTNEEPSTDELRYLARYVELRKFLGRNEVGY